MEGHSLVRGVKAGNRNVHPDSTVPDSEHAAARHRGGSAWPQGQWGVGSGVMLQETVGRRQAGPAPSPGECACVGTCIHACGHMGTCTGAQVCRCTCICNYMGVHACTSMCTRMCVHAWVRVCVHSTGCSLLDWACDIHIQKTRTQSGVLERAPVSHLANQIESSH